MIDSTHQEPNNATKTMNSIRYIMANTKRDINVMSKITPIMTLLITKAGETYTFFIV